MPSNRIVAMVAAAAVIGGGAGAAITTLSDGGSAKTTVVTTAATGANVANADLSVGQIAKDATKSVVEIDATSSGGDQSWPGGEDGVRG